MPVNLTDQLSQKHRIVNESRKTIEGNDNRTHLQNGIVPVVRGHTSWNNKHQHSMSQSILNLTLPTSSEFQSSSLLLGDQAHIFNYNKSTRKHHQQSSRSRNSHRNNHYRHNHNSHNINILSRRFYQQKKLIPKYNRKKRNKSDTRTDKNRHRRSSATNHVASSSFPSNVIIDSTLPLGTLRNIVVNNMDYGANTEKSDIVSRDNTSVIPTSINSMRIIRRDTNSLEIRTTMSPQNNHTWPLKRTAIIDGEIVVGGLHMVHERENQRICGPIMPQGGLQAAEVMLYSVDRINELGVLPGGLKLGAHILDDCDTDTYGLQQAVDFIKGSISNIEDDDNNYRCDDGSPPEMVKNPKVISGVVAAASSVTSIQVANLLKLFKIPQISFFSTSSELSNKVRFKYFSRTIPSDEYQTLAMAKIVEQLKWKYISIVYEDSNYGLKAFEKLDEKLTAKGVCIAVKTKLSKDSGVGKGTDFDHIIEKLQAKPKAKGVIVFGSDQEVAELMNAVKRRNATGQFYWIGSDGWAARALVYNGKEKEVEGTLSVQPKSNPVKGFEEYFLNLTVQNNTRNPWFVEFWEDHFKCRYRGDRALNTPYNQDYKRNCSGNEKLTKENTQFEAQLQFVSDAVMAFAHAFRAMHAEECGANVTGLCAKMKPINGEKLLTFLRQVNFTGLSGDEFKFNKSTGDGPARYNIIHYKQVSFGKYDWVTVGDFHDGDINLNMSEVQFRWNNSTVPPSVCSRPCPEGKMKKYNEGESCCWTCHKCLEYQILDPNDETRCFDCPLGTLPSESKLECVDIPEEYMTLNSWWAMVSQSFALLGIILTVAVIIVFLKYNDTPVVRASGRELSYVLLIGLLFCYIVTFLLMIKPTTIICAIEQFSIGLWFSVVYGALFIKTNRISRIFAASKKTSKRPMFVSPKSQLVMCSGIVLVQVLINVIWFLVSPPKAINHHPAREDNLLVCQASVNATYMVAFTYPIVLVIVCTVYAIKTRKIPEAFNESKYIGFSMYTTCVVWLAFIPIYLATASKVYLRITSMSLTISLSATVTICCMFLPKLSILLLHPEKNIRQTMMTSKHNNNFSTKGPQNACNVGIVGNSTKHIASTVVAPEINVVQQNGPSSLPVGAKNGKRAGVVIVTTDKDHKENGGIELRESLIPCKRKDDSLSSHSSNIAIKKEQKNGGSCELKNSETREGTPPFKAIKDEVCPSNDPNHSETCKEKLNFGKNNAADEVKSENDDGRKNSASKSLSVGVQSPVLDGTRQVSCISDNGYQDVLRDTNIVHDDSDLKEKRKNSKSQSSSLSHSNSSSTKIKVNATTETPPGQLVVTFTNDTIIMGGRSEDSLMHPHNNQQRHEEKAEIINNIDDDANDSIDYRKNSSEGSYSCCCDDSCFNRGCTLSHEKTISNLDSGKTTPSCFHSHSNTIVPQSTFENNDIIEDFESSSNYPNVNNKKKKVAVATQTASVNVSHSSSVGTSGSSEEHQSLKSLATERTLSSVIGEHNKGYKGSSHTTPYQLNASSNKYRHIGEPLSLMQEVPDVSL